MLIVIALLVQLALLDGSSTSSEGASARGLIRDELAWAFKQSPEDCEPPREKEPLLAYVARVKQAFAVKEMFEEAARCKRLEATVSKARKLEKKKKKKKNWFYCSVC